MELEQTVILPRLPAALRKSSLPPQPQFPHTKYLMKNVLIILLAVLALGAAGLFGTAFVLEQKETPSPVNAPVKSERDYLKALARSSSEQGEAMSSLRRRQTYAFIAGGIGAVAGLVVGIGLVKMLERRKKAA
jgi:hypothetical protein